MTTTEAEITRARGPSPHLSWNELACKDGPGHTPGTPYPMEWRADLTRAVKLATLFEEIREKWGKPIQILSAYRTPEYNRRIGGANASQHKQGRALDLRPPEGVTVEEFYKRIRYDRPKSLGGIGLYKTFVHVDVREITHHLATWFGVGMKDDRG